MTRKIVAAVAALLLGTTPLSAQDQCDKSKVAELVDIYSAEPFSARTWRVLKGLGDPMIERSYGGWSGWEVNDAFKKRAAEVAPDVKLPDTIGFDCRLGYPLEVLETRVKSLSPTNPYVKQWLLTQAAVVGACSGQKDAVLPPPLSEVSPEVKPLQDADRAYQEAARQFYLDREKSLQQFRTIGSSASPHKGAARYMVANILSNGKQIAEARKEATAILADQALAGVHPITQELLGYIANLEDTAEGWTALLDDTIKVLETPAKDILASPKLSADYARALEDIDYAGIRGKDDDWWLDGKLPENPTISKAIVDASRKHAMAPWMIGGQSAQAYSNILPWQMEGPKFDARVASLADRSLALVAGTPPLAKDTMEALKLPADDAARAALWTKVRDTAAAADRSCGLAPDTAATGFLLRQAVRASARAGKFDEAYAGLEAFPFKASNAYVERAILELGRYLLGEGLTAEGRAFRDRLLENGYVKGAGEFNRANYSDGYAQLLMWLAEDREHWNEAVSKFSAKADLTLFNFLSIKQLRDAAKDAARYSANERALFARAAWTRTYALGRVPDAALTKELMESNPGLKDIADKIATDYPKASAPRRRLLTVLRSPRHNILVNGPADWTVVTMADVDSYSDLDQYDHNDKNWWCPFEPDRQLLQLRSDFDQVAGQSVATYQADDVKAVIDPEIVKSLETKREATLKAHPVIKSIDWKELLALAKAPSAPKLLTTRAVAWGKASRGNDGAPEALALAVRATRYGCRWHGGHKAYSQPAQQLLQAKFGDTEWAKQTPYHFDCLREVWPKDDPNATSKVLTCEPQTWPKQPLPR
jgi:hypothetical protein